MNWQCFLHSTVSLCLWLIWLEAIRSSKACFPGGRLSRRRVRSEPPLLLEEHVPNVPELAEGASGALEAPIRLGDPRFEDLVEHYDDNVVFRDKEEAPVARKMTRRCKEKLDTLAMLVSNTWPGVKLRVLKAWAPTKSTTSFRMAPVSMRMHYEGRAVDLTTSDMDRGKHGTLARLAVQARFDWVHYEHKGHIHASVKTDTLSRNTRSLQCFPANSTVRLENGAIKTMLQLQLGDRVAAFDFSDEKSQRLFYTPVLGMLHKNDSHPARFLRILVTGGTSVAVTDEHLVWVRPTSLVAHGVFLPASSLRRGMHVQVWRGIKGVWRRVVGIRRMSQRGIYAPLTAQGTIIVDNVSASCYAGVNSHALAHAVLQPIRFLYSILPRSVLRCIFGDFEQEKRRGTKLAEYVHPYAKTLWTLADWLDSLGLYSIWHNDS